MKRGEEDDDEWHREESVDKRIIQPGMKPKKRTREEKRERGEVKR